MRTMILMIPVLLLLSGCQEELVSEPIRVIGPDLEPLKQGLSLLGIALVLSALIRAISDHWPRTDRIEPDPPQTQHPNQEEDRL